MIDYAAIATAFSDALAGQTRGWPSLFDRLEQLVDGLEQQAGVAERSTRAYPVLRYRDGALGVRLAPGSAGLLGDVDGSGRGLGQGLADGARQFAGGVAWVEDAVAQELALPRLAVVAVGMVAAVDASLARFPAASPGVFDARARRGSDLFGLAGLGFRALQGRDDQDQLLTAAFRVGLAAGFPGTLRGGAPSGAGAGPAGAEGAAGVGQLVADLEEQAGLTVTALLLLPAAGLTLDVLLADGVLLLQSVLVEEFRGIESEVYGLRGRLVDVWLTAFDAGTALHTFVAAADLVVGVNTALVATAVPLWLDGLLDGVEGMLRGLRDWAAWTGAVIGTFQVATTDLLSVDLLPWIVRNVLNDWVADHVPMPSFTLDDVVGLAISGHTGLRDRLDSFLDRVDDALWTVDLVYDVSDLRRRVAALREIFHLTLTPTRFTYPPDVLPRAPLAGFPDVYEALFGGGARAELLASVRRAGDELRGSLHDVGRAGHDLIAGLAGAAEAETRRQARVGAGLRLGDRWRAEGGLVAALVQPLRDDLEADAAAAPADPLAEAFDAGVSGGGILAATSAVPAYVGQMRHFWAARSAARAHPTSAHLLARRGRLAVVRVPRLTMRAHERTVSDALAEETAEEFQRVVVDAYRAGRVQLATLARPAEESLPARPRPRATGGARRGR